MKIKPQQPLGEKSGERTACGESDCARERFAPSTALPTSQQADERTRLKDTRSMKKCAAWSAS